MDIQNLIQMIGGRNTAHVLFLRGKLQDFAETVKWTPKQWREGLGDILALKEVDGYDAAFEEAYIQLVEDQSSELLDAVALHECIADVDEQHPALARMLECVRVHPCDDFSSWKWACEDVSIESDIHRVIIGRLKALASVTNDWSDWAEVYNLTAPGSSDREEVGERIKTLVGSELSAWITFVLALRNRDTDACLLALQQIEPLIQDKETHRFFVDDNLMETCIGAYIHRQLGNDGESFRVWTSVHDEASAVSELGPHACSQVAQLTVPFSAWLDYLEGLDDIGVNPMIRLAIERCAQLAPTEE